MSHPSVHKFISGNGHVRASFVDMTTVVEETRLIQETSICSTTALGRAMVGSVLMAAQLKHGQQIAVHFSCEGPLRTLYSQASYEGQVRAYVGNTQTPDMIVAGLVMLGPLMQKGNLTVSTYIPSSTQPHSSQVEIVSGEVAEDLVHYMNQSMQIPSVLSIGVHLTPEAGAVEVAGGVLIELMPGHTDEEIDEIEANVRSLPPISKLMGEGKIGKELIEKFLPSFGMKRLEHDFPVHYGCSCSLKRVKASLKLLTEDDWKEAIKENENMDVTCQMCGQKYKISPEEYAAIYKELNKTTLH